jgi:hypothetical protein
LLDYRAALKEAFEVFDLKVSQVAAQAGLQRTLLSAFLNGYQGNGGKPRSIDLETFGKIMGVLPERVRTYVYWRSMGLIKDTLETEAQAMLYWVENCPEEMIPDVMVALSRRVRRQTQPQDMVQAS